MHPAAQGRIPAAEIDARTRIILEAPLLGTIIRLAVPNAAVMVTQVSLGLIELYFLEFSAPWSNVLRITGDPRSVPMAKNRHTAAFYRPNYGPS